MSKLHERLVRVQGRLEKIEKHTREIIADKKAQAMSGSVLTAGVVVISLLIVGFVGVMILNSTSEAKGLESGDDLYNASQDLVNVSGTVFSMYGVLVIVLIASIIIGLLLSSFAGTGRE